MIRLYVEELTCTSGRVDGGGTTAGKTDNQVTTFHQLKSQTYIFDETLGSFVVTEPSKPYIIFLTQGQASGFLMLPGCMLCSNLEQSDITVLVFSFSCLFFLEHHYQCCSTAIIVSDGFVVS